MAVLALAACSDGTGPATLPTDGRITLNNDPAALASRVQYTGGQTIPITADNAVMLRARMMQVPVSASFKLQAVVASPVVNGQVLQASHVVIDGKYAFVSYMTQGEVSLGAVEVFDISKPDRPALVSQAVLPGTDVTAIATDGKYVYLATSTDDTTFAERAVLERVALSHDRLTASSTRVGLPSYAATGVDIAGSEVYVTSGTGGPRTGGLTILDSKTLAAVGADVLADARGVSAVDKKFIAVVQGTPARLRLYDAKSRAFVRSVALPGGGIPDSKSSVILDDDWGFVATGEGGMQVVDLARGTVGAALPGPTVAGVDPADAVTNAVSLSKDLVLTADGGAGVAVTYSDHGKKKSGETPSLVPLGRLALSGSANAIASDDETLFVANGTGGLQILEIDTN